MWHLGTAQQWKAFKVQKGFIFKRNGHWSAAFKGKDNSRAWRLDLCLRSKSLSLTLGGQYNIKATKRLRLQRVCKCKWCGGVLQTQHSPHSQAQAQAGVWSVGFTPVKTTLVYLSLRKPFQARVEKNQEQRRSELTHSTEFNQKVNTLESVSGRQAENPHSLPASTHHTDQKEWAGHHSSLGRLPHYPSLSCLGLLCHKLKANTSILFFVDYKFFPSILSESPGSHNQSCRLAPSE